MHTLDISHGESARITLTMRDGAKVVVDVAGHSERGTVEVFDSRDGADSTCEVFINGVDYSQDSF